MQSEIFQAFICCNFAAYAWHTVYGNFDIFLITEINDLLWISGSVLNFTSTLVHFRGSQIEGDNQF